MNILIIGESCIDEYIYCSSDRLCPEAPVPVLDIKNKKTGLGMAGNVYNNLLSLTKDINFITNENSNIIYKTRYVDDKTNHMFIRVDSKDTIDRINLNEYTKQIKNADYVIISDYNKGFLNENDIKKITILNKNVFIDTKKILGEWVTKAKFIKINRKEYNLSEEKIKEYNLYNKIIKTTGSSGAEYNGEKYNVKNVEIKDLSGAGDTFIASLVYKFSSTKNIKESIKFANLCSTQVVQQKGTSIYCV